MIFLVEFDAYNMTLGQVQKQYFGSDGFVTRPSDTPANTSFDNRLRQPGSYQRNVFAAGTTGGEAQISFGYIELANPDGQLDYLANMPIDGRSIVIWSLENTESPWSSRKQMFTGTMEQIEFTWKMVTIRIRDRLFELREDIQKNLFAGTTVSGGMNEAEGTPEDLKDKPKPLVFGSVKNVSPPLSNQYDLFYTLADNGFSQSNISVKDGGVPLTFTQNYANITQLRTATLTVGQYATVSTLGVIRVGGTPEYDLTVDFTENASQFSAARIVERILQRAGYTTAQYSQADLNALHTLNPAPVGTWIGTEKADFLTPINVLLSSIGAYMVPDRLGVFRFARLDLPQTAPQITLTYDLILDRGGGVERVVTNDQGNGLPAKKVTVKYAFNYTVQKGSAIAGAISPTVKAFVAEDWRNAATEDATVGTAYLMAQELEFETALLNEADAIAESQRRLNIYKAKRDRFRIPIKTDYIGNLDLGNIVELKFNRYGLDAGKSFVIIGVTENFMDNVTTLEVFG